MERIVSLSGLLVMIFLAWALSVDRRRMNIRLILSGIVLQFILAVLILRTSLGQSIFSYARIFVTEVIGFSNAGAKFVFGDCSGGADGLEFFRGYFADNSCSEGRAGEWNTSGDFCWS